MAVYLQTRFMVFSIGGGDLLHSFFSTIAYHLEDSKWGSRFPLIMNDLYDGHLDYSDLKDAKQEVKQIFKELEELSPDKVIWDFDDLTQEPPWGDDIGPRITNMATYYVTPKEKFFSEVFQQAFQSAKTMRCGIDIIAM